MTTEPFNLSPDPQFVYQTPLIKTALHKLRYVIERRQGATAILGDVGHGKTCLTRMIYRDYVAREDYAVALIPTPTFKSDYAFLKAICREFRLPPRRSLLDQQQELQRFVIEQFVEGKNVLLLIDEAQKLENPLLEILRTLLNFETDDSKCIQIVICGQIELRTRLDDERNRALKSRIFAPTILSPLSLEETTEMIRFRCELAGLKKVPFTVEAIDAIYNHTQGVPREVIKVCGLAYELARVAELATIDADLVAMAGTEAALP